jgi:hypothetical protein
MAGAFDTVAEFWSYLNEACGRAFPWLIVLVGAVGVGLMFRGRIAARWVFPIVLVLAAFWAIRRWLWIYFF